ncbi:MAG: class I SAM-dependent methyltransferase [Thermoanaerobaculia bacterium]|jgi:2-polyprenyl-3-methyl-5-hydroxy-6-metoxy-1,4-benzoquinol methylase
MDPSERSTKVARFWDQTTQESFAPTTYWLANPVVHDRYQRRATAGRSRHWVNYCIEKFLAGRRPVSRMLDVGCGDGQLDRHLLLLNAAERLDAIDISAKRIDEACRIANEQGLSSIQYHVQDAEADAFPAPPYDAVIMDSALHHMEGLEAFLAKTADSLEPDGYLFLNEYVGPNRFDLSQREKDLVRACFTLIPERYRRSLQPEDEGRVLTEPWIPDPEAVAMEDPSESVRSRDIPAALLGSFEILELHKAGGTLLHFVLQSIAGHFREEDPASMVVLRQLFAIEEGLIEIGELDSHFVLVVARPKQA